MTLYGFDVGSRTAKCFNSETCRVEIADSHRWREILPKDGEIISTGYFRKQVPNTYNVTEITAAAYGSRYLLNKEVDAVLDIGGQDTKFIDLTTNEFKMNDRCSAGTGMFFEFMAEYLGIKLEDMGRIHFKAEREAQINATCSVFAHTESISKLVEGYTKEEVVRGINMAFARRISGMVPDDIYTVALIGGAAKNQGVVDALISVLDCEIIVPEDPQTVNAVGALQYYIQRRL